MAAAVSATAGETGAALLPRALQGLQSVIDDLRHPVFSRAAGIGVQAARDAVFGAGGQVAQNAVAQSYDPSQSLIAGVGGGAFFGGLFGILSRAVGGKNSTPAGEPPAIPAPGADAPSPSPAPRANPAEPPPIPGLDDASGHVAPASGGAKPSAGGETSAKPAPSLDAPSPSPVPRADPVEPPPIPGLDNADPKPPGNSPDEAPSAPGSAEPALPKRGAKGPDGLPVTDLPDGPGLSDAPEQLSPPKKDGPKTPDGSDGPGDPRQGGGAADAGGPPKPLDDAQKVITGLQPHIQRIPELQEIDKQIAELLGRGEPTTPEDKDQLWRHYQALAARKKAIEDEALSAGVQAVTLPPESRGTLPVRGLVPPEIQGIVNRGRQIVESYVHRDLLPDVTFRVDPTADRAGHSNGVIHLSPKDDALTAAHEIVHRIEGLHPEVLQKSREFLAQRAAGEVPVRLDQIEPGKSHTPDEMAFEDKWVERGGENYSGKFYAPHGSQSAQDATSTELLTTGIERLHRNPGLFAATDPEYFSFILNTLRNL